MTAKKNILVIDDDSVAHFISEQIIGSLSFINKIYKAFNGLEGISLLESHCEGKMVKPDLILLDLHMPYMDGFQFLEACKNIECLKQETLEIAVLSSSDCAKEHERIVSLGVKHFIQKPLSPEAFDKLWKDVFANVVL